MELNLNTTIKPVQTAKPVVKAGVQYLMVTFGAQEWATARILLMDEDNLALRAEDVAITAAESLAWTGGDEYILTLALQKLGLTLATVVKR
ncbi:MAG: hypothetical protein FGM22_07330 [Burkholderiaceae bacterium]|nr:hypothetical protein [Burkholderiaceae bacterium]